MSFERLRRACLLLLHVLALPGAIQAQHFPADEDLRLMLRYIVEDAGAPGIVLGVLEADGSTRVVSWGSGGPDTRALSDRSIFEIGSITKTFTATVLADMVARGEVALDDPVERFLPDHVTVPSRNGREITLEHLATHTSGLPMWGRNVAAPSPRDALDDYDVDAMYAFLGSLELERDPGSAYQYSNLGFGLLGHALARAAGTPWPDLVRERVLDPLGMDMTGYRPRGEMEAWMTQGHDPGDVVAADTEARWGAGGLLSNARDMLVFLRANLQPMGSPLGEAMRLAQEPRLPTGETGNDIGLAWQTFRAGERSVVWHGGRRAGFMAQVGFDPERDLAAVVLTNTEAFTDSDLTTALLLVAPPPEGWEARADPATLPTYVGEYRGSSGGSFYIRLEDEGWLTYQPTGKARTRLYPRADRTFYMLRGPWSVTFHGGRGGEVTGMTMTVDEREPTQQGMERSLRRVSADVPPPDLVATGFVSSVSFPWALALKIAGVGVALLVVAGLATRLRKS